MKLGEIFAGFHRLDLQPNQKAFIHVIENLTTFAHHQRRCIASLGRAGDLLPPPGPPSRIRSLRQSRPIAQHSLSSLRQVKLPTMSLSTSTRSCARAQVIVGYGSDTELIEGSDNEGPFWRWKRTGEKIPIYAYGTDEIERKVPKELDDQAKKAWIDERTQEFIKEEERVKSEYAKTDQGKLEAASDVAAADEWYLLEELVETVPTTPSGLAALLTYVRTEQYVREQVFGLNSELTSLTNTYAWTMERLACAAAGLPEPPEHDAATEDDDA